MTINITKSMETSPGVTGRKKSWKLSGFDFNIDQIISIFIFLNVILSGITVTFFNRTGIFPFFVLPLAFFTLLRFPLVLKYRWWDLYALGLIFGLLVVNGSGFFSILFVFLNLFLIVLVQQRKLSLTPILRHEFLVSLVLLVLLSVAIYQLFIGPVTIGGLEFQHFWSGAKKELDVSRLRLLAIEPSYLGLVCFLLVFVSKHLFARIIFLGIGIAAFSYFSIITALVVLFRRWEKSVSIIIFVIYVSLTIYIALNIDVSFANSGFVRLAGISLFEDVNIQGILLGHGLGSGDILLAKELYWFRGVEVASGFFFSTLYDYGVVGTFCFFIISARRLLDVALLLLLLSNFGTGSVYIPFTLMVINSLRDQ